LVQKPTPNSTSDPTRHAYHDPSTSTYEPHTSKLLLLILPYEMHHCLEIEELLRTVFQWVYMDRIPLRGRCTLVSLAESCRIFTDTALDILWQELPTLVPLLKLLPDDLWELKALGSHCTHCHGIARLITLMLLSSNSFFLFRTLPDRLFRMTGLDSTSMHHA
jgi:hypothetical protein